MAAAGNDTGLLSADHAGQSARLAGSDAAVSVAAATTLVVIVDEGGAVSVDLGVEDGARPR
jgi:hypothetical protein